MTVHHPKRIVIAPDSLKGSLTAREVAAALEHGVERLVLVLARFVAVSGGDPAVPGSGVAGGTARACRIGAVGDCTASQLPEGGRAIPCRGVHRKGIVNTAGLAGTTITA
jgi:hypothetical protein